MKRPEIHYFTRLLHSFWLVISLCGLFIPSVLAQSGYPEPEDFHVNDYANLLTPEDETSLRGVFGDLSQETGIEAVVVTINSIDDYDTPDKTLESFATHLFNIWGIGEGQHNNGVLILVAVRDQEVRIEVGAGYGTDQNAKMQEIIEQQMLPSFRQNRYPQGIHQGAQAVASHLASSSPFAKSFNFRSAFVNGCWVLMFGGTLLFFIYRIWWRRRQPGYQPGSYGGQYEHSRDYSSNASSSSGISPVYYSESYGGNSDYGGDYSSSSSSDSGSSSGEGASGDW